MSLIAIWLGWTPPTLTPGVQGAQKGGPVGFWSLRGAFWQKLYKTKVAGHPQLSGVGHPIGPQIQIWKDLEPWSLTFKGSL